MGDTLFGQLCWAVRNRHGEERLAMLLENYTDGHPFAVVSDAFPTGYLPRPIFPGYWFSEVQNPDRKAVKKRVWLPLDQLHTPVASWLEHCQTSSAVSGGMAAEHPQPHNTLNRHTGTTGDGQFAPYAMNQLWYGHRKAEDEKVGESQIPVMLDVYVVLDESRLSVDELRELLADIGAVGFGRDASIGLGKYEVEELSPIEFPTHDNADAWMTLAPCAPQGLSWQVNRCFYQPFTRFGRHGDVGVHGQGGPFKTPVLLANTGAVLTPADYQNKLFTGQGLGGDSSLSKSIPGTVHQGYAPVVAIALPKTISKEVA
ncbi:MAG: type III-A CRISPR-associated RAMP protein Csm4 [Sulfuricaulis sp.]